MPVAPRVYFLTGNYPPEISVECAGVEGYPSPSELEELDWLPLVSRTPVGGGAVGLPHRGAVALAVRVYAGPGPAALALSEAEGEFVECDADSIVHG